MKSTKKIELPTPALCDRPEPKNDPEYTKVGRLKRKGTWHVKNKLPIANIYLHWNSQEHIQNSHPELNKELLPIDEAFYFAEDIAKNYTEIRLGSLTQRGSYSYLIGYNVNLKKTLNMAIELVEEYNGRERWYEVRTLFFRHPNSYKNKKLIWSSD